MKILLLCNKVPWPPNDGGAIASLSMARSLQHQGNDVTIIAMNTSKHRVDISKIPKQINDMISIHAVNVNTDLNALNAFFHLPGDEYSFFTSEN